MFKLLSRKSPGAIFESMAEKHLKKQGLRLLARNYHNRFGEIDIIMQEKQTIVFVEVRQRTSLEFGHPFETVDRRKQQKIILTAYAYLKEHRLFEHLPCRFDVVGVTLREGKHHLEWCQHAFEEL